MLDRQKIIVLACLGVPSLITFLFLWIFRDAFLTLLVLIPSLIIGHRIYNRLLEKSFDYLLELAIEIPVLKQREEQIARKSNRRTSSSENLTNSLVLKLTGILGGAGGAILFLFSLISPIGMKSITLPFPICSSGFFRMIYNLFFLALYHLALPATEILYFTVFLPDIVSSIQTAPTPPPAPGAPGNLAPAPQSQFAALPQVPLIKKELGIIPTLIICGAYAGVTWFSSFFIVTAFFAQLFVTGIAFAIMFVLLKVKRDQDFKKAVAIRYALSIAMLIWLLFLASTRANWFKRAQPQFMYEGNPANIWAKQ
jgi:hypothetical protein